MSPAETASWVTSLLLGALTVIGVLFYFVFRKPKSDHLEEGSKIAVIGGGIAGSGCAWALKRAGFEVHVFESHEALGGNAKTHTWKCEAVKGITTGLSVLAWPPQYFHNYTQLLNKFDIKSAPVELPFMVTDEGGQVVFEHGASTTFTEANQQNLQRWAKMVEFARKVNRFAYGNVESMYAMSFFNPLNLVSIRTLSRFYGISSEFWDVVVVPVYSSSFLSVELNSAPSVMLPLLSDLIPITSTPKMHSWLENSSHVFAELTRNCVVHLNSPVKRVVPATDIKPYISVHSNNQEFQFDRVVFACDAAAALGMLPSISLLGLQRSLLSQIHYVDETDKSFVRGVIHTDPTVLPPAQVKRILERDSNCVRILGLNLESSGKTAQFNPLKYENTFVLGSWYHAVQHIPLALRPPLLVTYNCHRECKNAEGFVENVRNHPTLSKWSQVIMLLLRYVQGSHGLYFCGSYVTPGNGHDLSLLSGFIVAHQMGAEYPFKDNRLCQDDYNRLAWLMGFPKLK